MWMRVFAALVCAAMAGCAPENGGEPAAIKPTAHELPLPPVKPALPQGSALPGTLNETITFARTV